MEADQMILRVILDVSIFFPLGLICSNQGCSRGRDFRDQDRDRDMGDRDRDMGGRDQDRDRGHLN